MKYWINGTRRGLGEYLDTEYLRLGYQRVANIIDADILFNVKHEGFTQVDLLYRAVELGVPRIINISSNSGDGNKSWVHPYAVQKAALDKANEQLFYQGINTTVIRFGYFDSPRVSHINEPKMSLEYCGDIVTWVWKQPHRIKDLTITP